MFVDIMCSASASVSIGGGWVGIKPATGVGS